MPRDRIKNSRRDLFEKGYRVIRCYISPTSKLKLERYQMNNKIINIDLALDNLINKSLTNNGGLK